MDHRAPIRDDDPAWKGEQDAADFRRAADRLVETVRIETGATLIVERRPNVDGYTLGGYFNTNPPTLKVTALDEHDLDEARRYLARYFGIDL